MESKADLVFVNGRVLTVDRDFTIASALAVSGEQIVAVGDERIAEHFIGPGTRVVDLAGGTLLPGINDSHCHALSFGLNRPPFNLDVGFPAVSSIADVVAMVADAVATRRPGEWIVGSGWDTGYLQECIDDPPRLPTRQDLDAVSPNNPVYLGDFSYHAAWCNSRALEAAGITSETVEPDGSTIVRDGDGEPTGFLTEGARYAVRELLPLPTHEQRKQAVRTAMHTMNALGITSYTEAGIGPGDAGGGMAEGGLQVYKELLDAAELSVRVTVLLLVVKMSEPFTAFRQALDTIEVPGYSDPQRCRVVGVKVLADGVPPSRTAWLHDEYVGGGFGALTVAGDSDEERVEQLRSMIAYAHAAGYQLGVHVTGDRGIDAVVQAFADAVRAHPRDDSRHYVIHGDLMTRESLATCAEFGFGVNMNPTIKWTIADLEEEFIGVERAAYEFPYRSAIDAGITVGSGSDTPVTFPDWRQGVSTMILRESKASGRVSGPEQRITFEEAIRTYTINAAWQDFADDWKGSLEVGKIADLCVVGDDLLDMDPHDLPHVPVTMTVLGGRIIHEAPAL